MTAVGACREFIGIHSLDNDEQRREDVIVVH